MNEMLIISMVASEIATQAPNVFNIGIFLPVMFIGITVVMFLANRRLKGLNKITDQEKVNLIINILIQILMVFMIAFFAAKYI